MNLSDRIQTALIVLISALLIGYTGFRAHEISFTYDESNTVLAYVGKTYYNIFQEAPTATNHALNTALTKAFASIFPASEFTFRLPNVLAHACFLMFAALLMWQLPKSLGHLRMVGFVLLVCNPYMLDFFSLCRGYGLALTFTLGTIYFWLRYAQQGSSLSLMATFLLSGLAVLSNFSLLNFYLGMLTLYLLFQCWRIAFRKGSFPVPFITEATIVFLISSILFLIIKDPLKELIVSNELFFGGETGLWHDTILSIILKSTYAQTPSAMAINGALVVFWFLFAIIVIGTAISVFRSWNERILTSSVQVSSLLLVILLGIIVQHHLFGTRFLIERTALFLLPLFILAFIFAVAEIGRITTIVASVLLTVPALVFTFHTASCMNLTHTLDWSYERDTRVIARSLRAQHFEHGATVGVNWPNIEALRFYKWLYDLNWMDIVENPASTPYEEDKKPVNTFYTRHLDMAFVNQLDVPLFHTAPSEIISYSDGRTFVQFPYSEFAQTTFHGTWQPGSTQMVDGDEFLGFISDSLNKFVNEGEPVNLKLSAVVRLKDDGSVPNVQLVLTIGSTIYRSVSIGSDAEQKNGHLMQLFFKESVPADASTIKVYLWNIDGKKIEVTDFEMVVLTGERS